MSIVIDTPLVHKSIATILKAIDSNAYIYDNPNQQATKLPAWFIIHREPVKIEREIGRAWLVYSLDLCYMLEYNTTRLFDDYATIADNLNTALIYLPIYGYEGVKTQVYEREWGLQLDALRYSITLRFRVSQDTVLDEKMQVIESLDVFLKNQHESIITFTNPEHPEFDPDFPNSLSVMTGRKINLPFVGGTFEDEDYQWKPIGWSLGGFGELIQVDKNLTTELLWESTNKTATITFANSHPEFSVELPADITANKGSAVTLPEVDEIVPVGPIDWRTVSWDIGNFGSEYTLTGDVTATLQWTNQEVIFNLTYVNSLKPEFVVELPSSMQVARGNHVILPTIEGTYYEGNFEWWPEAWSIGQFGADLVVEHDLSAELLWAKQELLSVGGVLTAIDSTTVFIDLPDRINVGSVDFDGGQLSPNSIPESGVVEEYSPSVPKRAYMLQDKSNAWFSLSDMSRDELYDEEGQRLSYDSSKTYTVTGLYLNDDSPVQYTSASLGGNYYGFLEITITGFEDHLLCYAEYIKN